MVRGCVANDRQWQELLYRRFFPAMMAMCMRHAGDREEAMTIVNNGFLRVFKKINLYSGTGSLEGWIRRIVWHSVADYYRAQSRYLRFLELDDRDEPVKQSPADGLYAEDIMRMVEELPRASQEVFRLFAIEGYAHAEIAERIGISVGTSKWHVNAARTLLKKLLARSEKPGTTTPENEIHIAVQKNADP